MYLFISNVLRLVINLVSKIYINLNQILCSLCSLYKCNMVLVCVVKDLANHWTDMDLLYSKASHRPREGSLLFLTRVPPFSQAKSILKKKWLLPLLTWLHHWLNLNKFLKGLIKVLICIDFRESMKCLVMHKVNIFDIKMWAHVGIKGFYFCSIHFLISL